jgi:hypothetical protein
MIVADLVRVRNEEPFERRKNLLFTFLNKAFETLASISG